MKQILFLLLLFLPVDVFASEGSDVPTPPPSEDIPVSEPGELEDLPAGEISGLLEMPRHEKMPELVHGRIRLPAGQVRPGFPKELKVECPVSEGRWVCHFPAGEFDFRLRASGFVSHFLWNTEIRAHKRLDLGTLKLVRGASVVGRLEAASGAALSSEKCSVFLSPVADGAAPSAVAAHRQGQRRLEGKVLDGGFFELEGVRPGVYQITAMQPGVGEGRFFPVTVMENAETEVLQPIQLEPPLELEIVVEPPLDPFDRPWSWTLFEEADGPFKAREVAKGSLSRAGMGRHEGLRAGNHLLALLDEDGQRFAFEELELSATSRQLFIDLPLVWVEGTLSLAGEPLSAEIGFGGNGGKQKVKMLSDREGNFTGYLPSEGEWSATIRSRHPEIRAGVEGLLVKTVHGVSKARLDIELPNTELAGEVVDENGQPVLAALVRVHEAGKHSPFAARTDREGRFSLRGMKEGLQLLSAEGAEGSSKQIFVHAEEGRPQLDLHLVLEQDWKISGRVLSPSGGVPGARILAGSFQPDGSLIVLGRDARTDIQGNFHLSVPGAANRVQLAILAPPYALTLREVVEQTKGPLILEVEPRGGSLSLNLDQESEEGEVSRAQPVLFVDGKVLDLGLLHHWAHFNGAAISDSTQLTVPQMPPGSYTACLLAVDRGFLSNPAAASSLEGCVEGFLGPGGNLSLSPSNARSGDPSPSP